MRPPWRSAHPTLSRTARCGIAEAWLVDLTRNVLEVHRDPARDGYRKIQRFRRGDQIAPQAFPDFTIAVESILP